MIKANKGKTNIKGKPVNLLSEFSSIVRSMKEAKDKEDAENAE